MFDDELNNLGLRVKSITTSGWASITFSGCRHKLVLTPLHPSSDDEFQNFGPVLMEHEFHIPKNLVADVQIDEINYLTQEITCEILTLTED